MKLFRWIYRLWLRNDLHWIEGKIEDELERHARHDATMKMLRSEAATLRWRLHGTKKRAAFLLSGLKSTRRQREEEARETALRG